MTGTWKILAALASPITLLKRSWRSIDMTPKVIWGWWSMKMTVQFCGVSRLWIRFVGAGASAMKVPPLQGPDVTASVSQKEGGNRRARSGDKEVRNRAAMRLYLSTGAEGKDTHGGVCRLRCPHPIRARPPFR